MRGHYPLIMIRNLGIFLEHTNFNFPAFLHRFAPFLIVPTLVDAIKKGMVSNFSLLLYDSFKVLGPRGSRTRGMAS